MKRAIAVYDYLDRAITRHDLWVSMHTGLSPAEQHMWNMEVGMLHTSRADVGCWIDELTGAGVQTRKVRTVVACN